MAKIKIRKPDQHHSKPKGVTKHAFERVYWPYIPVVFIISALLLVGSNSGSLRAYARHPGGRVLDYATSMSIDGLLADTNAARSDNGVANLSLNDKLDAAAQAQADDMAARDYWSHYTPEGSPPWVWVTNQGYAYQALAQNLATGFSDEQATVDGWMGSPDHRTNLLNPIYKDVGFGYSNSPNYTAAGGGPMTIIVAFYGEPQVLAATTPAPIVTHITSPPPAAVSTPATAAPVAATSPPPSNTSTTKSQPPSAQTAQPEVSQAVKSSRLQLTFGNTAFTSAATGSFVALGILIFAFWASRHLRAIHRFLLKGERYAIRHPLLDIGLVVIACLLFILGQTAGIIQ